MQSLKNGSFLLSFQDWKEIRYALSAWPADFASLYSYYKVQKHKLKALKKLIQGIFLLLTIS